MHPGRELSEDEQRVRLAGLRLLARMIAERMLAERAAAAAGASRRPMNGAAPAQGADTERPGRERRLSSGNRGARTRSIRRADLKNGIDE